MDSIVVITGGAGGIGAGLAAEFLDRRAKVVILLDLKQDALLRVKTQLCSSSGSKEVSTRVDTFAVDCLIFDDLCHVFEQISLQYGSIDYLFCNAGKVANTAVDLLSGQQPDFTLIDNHIHVPLNTIHAAIPHLARSTRVDRAVIVTSSMAGMSRYHPNPHYCIGKHGGVGIVHAYAGRFPPGIRLVGVAPYFVRVPSVEALLQRHPEIDAMSLSEVMCLFKEAVDNTDRHGQVLYCVPSDGAIQDLKLPESVQVPSSY